MTLLEFLIDLQRDVRSAHDSNTRGEHQLSDDTDPEVEFVDHVVQHMFEHGMTSEPFLCSCNIKTNKGPIRLNAYAISEDSTELDLFVALYSGSQELVSIPDADTKKAAEQCLRFLEACANGKLTSKLQSTDEAYGLALNVEQCYEQLDQIRIYVLTDRQAKSKSFQPRQVAGKTLKLEVMDIERLFRHLSAGKPRDEIELNFDELCGAPLPCVYVPSEGAEYDYALTAFPAETLRFVYEKYGARLLEANVRSFLSTTAKVNRGIRDTLLTNPDRFMAYNNGIVIVADAVRLASDGSAGVALAWMQGMQIVNGGQTTASLYFTKKKNSAVDLTRVRVSAKIIVLKAMDPIAEESLISDISRYANSQNAVRQADLSANKTFHVEIEKLSKEVYCSDGVSRWFYERATGSYSVMLATEGGTPSRLRKLKDAVPSSRKISKTDLAKYMNAWEQKPHVVSWGAQKNFEEFMSTTVAEFDRLGLTPDPTFYKSAIAKAILFKSAQRLARVAKFPAFQANIVAYTVALLSNRVGSDLDLEKIWQEQEISIELGDQLSSWAAQVYKELEVSAAGRMISEWAKKPECWEVIRSKSYPAVRSGIPELRTLVTV